MFLGYQTNLKTGKKFIAMTAETREELENTPLMVFDKIEESDIEYKLFMGKYMTPDELIAARAAADAAARCDQLRANLAAYDYIGTKIATGRATREEYAKQIEQMREWASELKTQAQIAAHFKHIQE